jgi:hypothetical protein
MILRVVIGVLNEAWILVTKQFLEQRINKEYRPLLNKAGVDALDRLKKTFGASGLFATLRGTYIFHHPNKKELNVAFERTASDPQWDKEWNWYWFLSHSNYNSFYFFSEFVILHGFLNTVGEADLIAGHKKLMEQVRLVSEDMSNFIMALIEVFWKNTSARNWQPRAASPFQMRRASLMCRFRFSSKNHPNPCGCRMSHDNEDVLARRRAGGLS